MTEIILTSAKYLIIIFFAYFVYISFRAQRDVPDENKKASFVLQRIFTLLIHGLAFFCICINISINSDISLTIPKTIGLYCGQLAYLVLLSYIIPKFVSLSKGLNNVMCMFLAIGFIIQTRLDFNSSVRQFYILLFGTAVFLVFVFLCKRAKFLRKLTWIYAASGMILLLLVLILATVTKGAKLALDLGFFSFQPMEFVKIIFVMFVASAFYKSNSFKTVLITAVCAAIHVLIVVFCRDLGSALILSIIYILMLYVATKKILYVGIGVVGFAAAAFIAYHLFDHVQTRILIWLNPWDYIDNKGYQIAQSLFAIGTGGWFGSGIFRGSPKYIPEVSNDMVFSAISEELGAIFSILLIMLTLCFILMIMRVAIRVNNLFYKLMAFGLGAAYA
ncbi:MAG: FtsW/RodA/SpoVE family cell cycle protein, partial [Lachnospiraceae bacterium]|nr:FtsW/RodA/SpoVE family cell cycle protein [Lachnospiraceae bacterium]